LLALYHTRVSVDSRLLDYSRLFHHEAPLNLTYLSLNAALTVSNVSVLFVMSGIHTLTTIKTTIKTVTHKDRES